VDDRWADRTAAGRALGAAVAALDLPDPVVLGLARGGVEVAAPVAALLRAPLDVLVVRKVGHPAQRELGLGAVAEDGPVVWDAHGLAEARLTPADLADAVAAERAECRRRVSAYRGGRAPARLAGRTAVLVDDGVATGVTARAAVRAVAETGALRIVLAAPVVAAATVPVLEAEGAEVVALLAPRRFGAVSRWYADFGQTPDATVVALLTAGAP